MATDVCFGMEQVKYVGAAAAASAVGGYLIYHNSEKYNANRVETAEASNWFLKAQIIMVLTVVMTLVYGFIWSLFSSAMGEYGNMTFCANLLGTVAWSFLAFHKDDAQLSFVASLIMTAITAYQTWQLWSTNKGAAGVMGVQVSWWLYLTFTHLRMSSKGKKLASD